MADLSFHDILHREGIAPSDVNVILHSPGSTHGNLLEMLPGLAKTRRRAVETFQASHSPGAERTLSRGRPWVASFVYAGSGRVRPLKGMLFIGLYANLGGAPRSRADITADPEVQWLRSEFGYLSELNDPTWTHWTWFDLRLSERMAELQGRLVIEARLTPNYVRVAENLVAPVLAIHQVSTFDAAPPSWRRMTLGAGMIDALPAAWAAKLAEWRGVYLIVDTQDGSRYVGCAYGRMNLLGRWRQHISAEGGITVGLSDRDPQRFRFSILELTSPTAEPREVIALEQTWMDRLDTIRFGLNRPRATGAIDEA